MANLQPFNGYDVTDVPEVSAGTKMTAASFNQYYTQFVSNDKTLDDKINNLGTDLNADLDRINGELTDAIQATNANLTQNVTQINNNMSSLSQSLNADLNVAKESMQTALNTMNATMTTNLNNLDTNLTERINKLHNKISTTLPSNGWSSSGTTVLQVLPLSVVMSSDDIEVGLEIPAAYTGAQVKAARKQFGFITRAETINGGIQFYCQQSGKFPTIDLPIYVKGA